MPARPADPKESLRKIFAVIDQGLHRDSAFFGVLAAIQGGGAVLGGITAAAVIGRLGERRALATGLGLLGAGLGLAAVANLALVCASVVLVGLCIPWTVVSFTTMRQRLTPARLQGRVSAATNMALNGPQTVGTAAGALLIAVVDYRILIVVMGLTVVTCAGRIARSPADASATQAVDPMAADGIAADPVSSRF
jgi:predicted MFS family arabinose efflux permease